MTSPSTTDRWPFHRYAPDCVTLAPRPGTRASDLPPVRIFLGTEEAQYRAERIFFYSIEKVRDPSRTYEIHLMKNLEGFDRRKWRTGFTNYRYAIPELAGGSGRAIYNDVDQIYLADPALLFDLEMGEHGYLAISAKDTSVMLMDCARMSPDWNRGTASSLGKHQLIDKPASTPGLWGKLDGHWNARDQEYVEGLTKCLHYTALHQQPWHPFPDTFSYHPNPLAYIWHDLEREADAQGFELYGADDPSPNFTAVIGGNLAQEPTGLALSESFLELVREMQPANALILRAGDCQVSVEGLPEDIATSEHVLDASARWPEGAFDAVLAAELVERIPPADIPWVLDGLFERARKLVHLRLPATEPDGLGSTDWWRKRMEEAARRHPGVSWQLDMLDRAAPIPGTVVTIQTRRRDQPASPTVWAIMDGDVRNDAQVSRLVSALGWGFETKRIAYGLTSILPNWLLGASKTVVDEARSSRLEAPWPDLVVAAGEGSAPVSSWIKKASGGRSRIVQLDCPSASFDLFDLIVTGPQHRLPVRDNVFHVAAPLAGVGTTLLEESREHWAERLAGGAEPRTVLVAGKGRGGYRLTRNAATELGKLTTERLRQLGGSLWIALEPDLPSPSRWALLASIGVEHEVLELEGEPEGTRDGLVAAADRCILTGDDAGLLATACLQGKPVDMFEPPRWHDAIPGAKPVIRLLTLLAGGGTSYRGTPHQQHLLARGIDHLTTRGLVTLPRDLTRLHRALVARGLVTRLGDERMVASRKALNDVDLVVERVRRLMTELPPATASMRV